MFQVASLSSVFALPVQSRSRQSSVPLCCELGESSSVIPFPIASVSESDGWQSVGEAASNVLRHLRPLAASPASKA